MGTYIGTLVTLNTLIGLPFRNINGNTPLFKSSSTGRECSVLTPCKGADRQRITLEPVDGFKNVFDEIGQIRKLVLRTSSEIRGLSYRLHPTLLVDLGLVARQPFIIGLGFAGLLTAMGTFVYVRRKSQFSHWLP